MMPINYSDYRIPSYPVIIGIPEIPILNQFYSPIVIANQNHFQNLITNQRNEISETPHQKIGEDKKMNIGLNEKKIQLKPHKIGSNENKPGRWTFTEHKKFLKGSNKKD